MGARPAWFPYHIDHNPYRLTRVWADQKELDKWLNYLDKHPEERYVSDGNPDFISILEQLLVHLNEQSVNLSQVRTYQTPGGETTN